MFSGDRGILASSERCTAEALLRFLFAYLLISLVQMIADVTSSRIALLCDLSDSQSASALEHIAFSLCIGQPDVFQYVVLQFF
jgi:hypothetical protein